MSNEIEVAEAAVRAAEALPRATGSVLTVVPVNVEALLSEAAKTALAPPFKELVYPRPERKTIFVAGIATTEAAIPLAAAAIADVLNQIAEHEPDTIKGHLAPMSSIVLADGRYAVFNFPVVRWEFEPRFAWFLNEEEQELFVPEGSIGTRVFEVA
jgi:hypothetical protein